MTCIKCGLNEAVTTAGLCRQCQIYAQPLVHFDLAQEALATCNVCGMYYYPSKGTCLHQESKFLDKETLERLQHGIPLAIATPTPPPQWFKDIYQRHYPEFVAEQVAAGFLRMPWDVYFLAICDAVKLRSIDKDTQNGAVIVNEHRRLVSTGYNAFPAGVDDDFWPRDRETKALVPYVSEDRTRPRMPSSMKDLVTYGVERRELYQDWVHEFYTVDKYMPMTHAEMNAVVSAGQDLHGCCIYTLLFPCHECAKAIITSGIKRVVFVTTREDPSWAVAKELFLQAGVEMVGPEKP